MMRWMLVVLLAANGFGIQSAQAHFEASVHGTSTASTMHCHHHHHHQIAGVAEQDEGNSPRHGQPCGCCDTGGHCTCLLHAQALNAAVVSLALLILPAVAQPALQPFEHESTPFTLLLRPPIS